MPAIGHVVRLSNRTLVLVSLRRHVQSYACHATCLLSGDLTLISIRG